MNKTLTVVLYVILAFPIPLSLMSIPGSLVTVKMFLESPSFDMYMIVPLFTMLLASMYTITYAISLFITVRNGEVSFTGFLPLFHLAIFGIFLFLWMKI